jgi:NAD(P)-dependent dehydrogenase (short-subunit alcohol dehydrogenase family)
MGRLDDKVALITGAASGIGAASAALFAREGAAVVLVDRAEAGEGVADAIRAAGGEAAFAQADVTNAEQVERAVALAQERYGKLDVLFNNAGIGPPTDADVHEIEDAVWDRILEVNLRGVFLGCRFGIRAMLGLAEPRAASVINTASVLGIVGNPTLPSTAYTASKGGIVALTRQLAASYGPAGIRCNAICPGPIDTPILEPFLAEEAMDDRFKDRVPLGRMGRAEEVAYLALFLASDEASYVTGGILPVDGGMTCI